MKPPQAMLDRMVSLPPLPDTLVKLLTVLNDPDSSVRDVMDIVRYDQALTAEVMRMCNSAFMALPRPVHSLSDAMRYLGTMQVLNLVMTLHGGALMSKEQRNYGLAAGELWRHSVGAALAASRFAERIHVPNPNLSFTAGLLHDIGKLVLNECVSDGFDAVLSEVKSDGLSFGEAERQVLGYSHDELGAALGEQWRLPEAIVRCIRHHHDPAQLDPSDPLVDTVYLADCVCLLMGIGLGVDGLYYRADAGVMQRHALCETDLEVIGAQVLSELGTVEQMFAQSRAKGSQPDSRIGERPCRATS